MPPRAAGRRRRSARRAAVAAAHSCPPARLLRPAVRTGLPPSSAACTGSVSVPVCCIEAAGGHALAACLQAAWLAGSK